MRPPRSILPALLTVLLTAPAATGQDAATPNTVLRPGDVLLIEIWREPDLGGEFLVDESGTVTLPLLGERRVEGIPIPDLRDSLIADYREELRNPSISITPLRRVYVLGEVNAPGLRTVDPTVSLAGAIALAGGASATGDIRRIRVIRDDRVILSGVSAESALATVDVRSGDQIFVDRRNWLDRNSTFVISSVLGITSIVISLVR